MSESKLLIDNCRVCNNKDPNGLWDDKGYICLNCESIHLLDQFESEARHHYFIYKYFLNKVYDIDESRGDKLNNHLNEMGD